MSKYERGFGLPQTLLMVVIVGIIGSTAWYVYTSRKQASPDSSTTVQSQPENPKPEAIDLPVDETADWLLYESAGKEFKIRIADGWKLQMLNRNLFGRSLAAITYQNGTKATVTETEGGWDGASPFSLYYPGSYADEIVQEGEQQGTITTKSGLVARKFYFVQTTEPEGIGYQKHDKVYNYYFDKDGKSIQIQYVISAGQPDQTELIEKVIKTLEV